MNIRNSFSKLPDELFCEENDDDDEMVEMEAKENEDEMTIHMVKADEKEEHIIDTSKSFHQ